MLVAWIRLRQMKKFTETKPTGQFKHYNNNENNKNDINSKSYGNNNNNSNNHDQKIKT